MYIYLHNVYNNLIFNLIEKISLPGIHMTSVVGDFQNQSVSNYLRIVHVYDLNSNNIHSGKIQQRKVKNCKCDERMALIMVYNSIPPRGFLVFFKEEHKRTQTTTVFIFAFTTVFRVKRSRYYDAFSIENFVSILTSHGLYVGRTVYNRRCVAVQVTMRNRVGSNTQRQHMNVWFMVTK